MTKRAGFYLITGSSLLALGFGLVVLGVWLYLGGYERWILKHVTGFQPPALSIAITATRTEIPLATLSPVPTWTRTVVMTRTPEPTGTATPTPTPSPTPTPLTWRSVLLPLIEGDLGQTRLTIPGLLVDAAVTLLQPDDAGWDISQLEDDVGWLNGTGRFPNDQRAIVLIAHNWVATGWRGPFVLLHLLKPDHKLSLLFQGKTYQYKVIAKEIVEPDDIDALTSRPGNQLLLVTCWNYDAPNHQYLQRLIVVTELLATQ